MINQKYTSLIQFLPNLENIINRNLSSLQVQCLDHIYNYYYNKQVFPNKTQLRAQFMRKRKDMGIRELALKSNILNNIVLQSQLYRDAATVFCYISFKKEIDTQLILEQCLAHKRLCVPVINNNEMTAALIHDLNGFKKNKYGILEPIDVEPVAPAEIDLVIVPALAYNYLGFRVGYGGGYYDRFLAHYQGQRLGMIFKDFLTAEFIPQSNDIPIDNIYYV